MQDTQSKLQDIIDLTTQMAAVSDLDVLLERILTVARRFASADSGTVYVRDGDHLHFHLAQNDTFQRRMEPGRKLPYASFEVAINSQSIAGHVAATGETTNIANVYELPSDVPYSFGRSYDERTGYCTRSMLTVPLRTSRGDIVGVLQLINATSADGEVVAFTRDDERMIQLFASSAAVAMERAQMTRQLLLRMIGMAELRDPSETGAHVNRVAAYSLEIFERWAHMQGMPQDQLDRRRDLLRMAAILHDVGKVAISDTILKKPGRFTDEEFTVMKSHTVHGAQLFSELASEFDQAARDVALNHHENWDGTGYPGHVDATTGDPLPAHTDEAGRAKGKVAEEIPVFGRVVAIADVYDALLSKRCYKDPMEEQAVLDMMRDMTGKKFDPTMMEAFYDSLDVLRSIRSRYPG